MSDSPSRRGWILPAVAVVAAGVALAWFKVADGDVFWHLKAGQVMLERRELLRTNRFSSTFPDFPWVNPEWLFQAALAKTYALGGWAGVAALKCGLAAAVGCGLYAALLFRGAAPWVAGSLAVLALAVMRVRLTERPHLVSYVFFASVMALWARARAGRPALLWALPPLFALWSNVHPELLLGLLWLGASYVGTQIDRRAGGPARAGDSALPLLPLLLCVPATLANPETWRVAAFPFLHFGLGPVIDLVEYRSSLGFPAPLFWILLAAAALALGRRRTRRAWEEVVPAGGLALLAVLYLRAIPYFALAVAPALSRRWGAPGESGRSPPDRLRVFLHVAAAAAALLWALLFEQPDLLRPGWGVNERQFPVAAADLLAREEVPGTLYNGFNEGGYLIFRLWPRLGVFQDGRLPAYPREFLAALHGKEAERDWQEILAERGVNTALVVHPQREAMGFTRAAWGVVFWDDAWCVLVRRGAAQEALLGRLEYREFVPAADLSSVADPERLVRLAGEIRRNQEERRRPSAESCRLLGRVLRALGRSGDAVEAFQEATRLDPASAAAWLDLGLAREESGDRAGAVQALRRALDLDPSNAMSRAVLGAIGGEPAAETVR